MIHDQTPLFNKDYRIIAIGGKAKSGKDTIASIFVKKYKFVRISFADDLKTLAGIYFGLTRAEMYLQKTKESRRILQGLGSLLREEVDRDYWIQRVHDKIKRLKLHKRIVVPDCRYINEMSWVFSQKGIAIKVVREKLPPIESGKEHSSEIELDSVSDESWDFIIQNKKGGSWKKDLERQVDEIALNLLQKEWLY